ncbi:MAG TPA: hypothetical protein VKA48_09925 [Gammaproteobacteria bacterium]|nr:hypothetical protein [Gammaproteobacteria bacterium]
MNIKRALVGDTVRFTWVNSGTTPGALHLALYDGAETLVSSQTMASSGNGHYYADVTLPDTPGFYVGETFALVDGKDYKRRVKVRAVLGEVD